LLQEHSVVLVRVGRLKDVPGVKTRCVRGKYDLPHVIKKKEAAGKK
jgi:small subunit ribosomal protein S12